MGPAPFIILALHGTGRNLTSSTLKYWHHVIKSKQHLTSIVQHIFRWRLQVAMVPGLVHDLQAPLYCVKLELKTTDKCNYKRNNKATIS